jgi:hypothetical protein
MCFLLCVQTDVSVVTSDQIYFLSTNNTLYSIENKLKIMGAIAYNPITKDIYVSDSSQNKASIFRIKYIENAYSSIVEPIVACKSNFNPIIFVSIIIATNVLCSFNNITIHLTWLSPFHRCTFSIFSPCSTTRGCAGIGI